MRSTDFPRFPDSVRRSDYRADPAAPPCPTTRLADTTLWRLHSKHVGTPTKRVVTVQLPPQYTWGFPGVWSVRTGSQMPVASFDIWLGSGDRYPIAGISPPPQQVAFRECQLPVSGKVINVVLFTLQRGAEPRRHWVSAYGRIQDSVWMYALGDEVESATTPDWLAVLRTIHIEGP